MDKSVQGYIFSRLALQKNEVNQLFFPISSPFLESELYFCLLEF